MTFRTLDDASDLAGKTALVRVDFNVPMEDGKVSDDTRLRSALPTIQRLRDAGAKVALLAHFDRPKGQRVPEMSLQPVVDDLERLLGAPVRFADDCVGDAARTAIADLDAGGVILLENVRFHAGEEKNDPAFAAQLAALGDLYVNDAFSAAHRAHASTEGLARLLPAYAGEAMKRELEALDAALGNPVKPVLGIVGGAKVSTKLDLLKNLVGRLDRLAIGGGMANTFLFAQGIDIGGSLAERDMAETAREIIAEAEARGCELLLPIDVVVATEVKPEAETRAVLTREEIGEDEKILDAGPLTVEKLVKAMALSRTLIWNGPLGVFEVPPFDAATVKAAQAAGQLATSGAITAVAGGGDTVSALNHAGVVDQMTFVSTAGGAFLEWMEGKPLPGVEALRA
ncbi:MULTISPECIES: phosphoglycerate kinase [unclassified Brevundimonas]|jgi:phosphoglycerate kinase|uniref:phosphoglycerate kinase n=1 Tax=unclassified Brevundimonas TaxID=2622653 RepID=UPI000EEB8189|nr:MULTISPECIES: phosphoglycerate kinase [unclassified Brevundimonas]HAJ02664.1 phosphoglycerate kinase [Brevundimonas sp.]|tara:strand:- start:4660 stop:5856 length:1197 start_codon:yes stop_codon:yes gene_type:complete